MALTKCGECGKEVSSSAEVCTNCGYKGIVKDFKRAEAEAFASTPRGKIANAVIFGIIILVAHSWVSSCQDSYEKKTRKQGVEFAQCIVNGESYFRDIKSWPRLSDGRDALEVVKVRCTNTTGAFGQVR